MVKKWYQNSRIKTLKNRLISSSFKCRNFRQCNSRLTIWLDNRMIVKKEINQQCECFLIVINLLVMKLTRYYHRILSTFLALIDQIE